MKIVRISEMTRDLYPMVLEVYKNGKIKKALNTTQYDDLYRKVARITDALFKFNVYSKSIIGQTCHLGTRKHPICVKWESRWH